MTGQVAMALGVNFRPDGSIDAAGAAVSSAAPGPMVRQRKGKNYGFDDEDDGGRVDDEDDDLFMDRSSRLRKAYRFATV